MRRITVLLVLPVLLSFGLVLLIATPAHAYIGPGSGLTAIGAFLALIAVGVITFFGFLWYPIKRLLRKRRRHPDPPPGDGNRDAQP